MVSKALVFIKDRRWAVPKARGAVVGAENSFARLRRLGSGRAGRDNHKGCQQTGDGNRANYKHARQRKRRGALSRAWRRRGLWRFARFRVGQIGRRGNAVAERYAEFLENYPNPINQGEDIVLREGRKREEEHFAKSSESLRWLAHDTTPEQRPHAEDKEIGFADIVAVRLAAIRTEPRLRCARLGLEAAEAEFVREGGVGGRGVFGRPRVGSERFSEKGMIETLD